MDQNIDRKISKQKSDVTGLQDGILRKLSKTKIIKDCGDALEPTNNKRRRSKKLSSHAITKPQKEEETREGTVCLAEKGIQASTILLGSLDVGSNDQPKMDEKDSGPKLRTERKSMRKLSNIMSQVFGKDSEVEEETREADRQRAQSIISDDLMSISSRGKRYKKLLDGMKDKLSSIMESIGLRRKGLEDLERRGILKKGAVFGNKLENLSEDGQVPRFLYMALNLMEANEAWMKTEHIYRQPGNMADIQTVRFEIENGDYESLERISYVHKMTGVIKLFLRELQEPVLPWIKAQEICVLANSGNPNLVNEIKLTLDMMPPSHRNTLIRLIQHLRRVLEFSEENHLNEESLATVFGPCLSWLQFYAPSEMMNIARQQRDCVQILLKYHKEICP